MSGGSEILGYFRPQPSGNVPAFPPIGKYSPHAVRLGMAVLLAFFVLIGLLVAEDGTPLIPGSPWPSLVGPMQYYLGLMAVAIGIIAVTPLSKPRSTVGVIEPGGPAGFLVRVPAFGAVTAAIAIAYVHFGAGGGIGSTLPDTTRLEYMIYFSVVGFVEELTFRVALTPWAGSVGSSMIFALSHIVAYTTGQVSVNLLALGGQILIAGILGFILWLVYIRWGYGAAASAHISYDLTVAGVLCTGTAAFSHLGLVPF